MKKSKKYIDIFLNIRIPLLTNKIENDNIYIYIKENCKKSKKKLIYKGKSMNQNETILSTKIYKKISAFDGANFIIQLYYKTGQKYHCARSKVEKLLSIAGFVVMAKNAESLYNENIVLNSCGTGFAEFPGYFPPDLIEGTEKETNAPLEEQILQSLDESAVIPLAYNELSDDLEEATKKLLENVFIKFGNYGSDKLGKAIDEFKKEVAVKDSNGRLIIDPKKFHDSLSSFPIKATTAKESKINVEDLLEKLKEQMPTEEGKKNIQEIFNNIIKVQQSNVKIVDETYNDIIKYIKEEAIKQ